MTTTVLRNLEQLGVRPENLIATANLLNNYVLSFVPDELRWQRALPGDTKELFGYPVDLDFDRQFRYGVQNAVVIGGGIAGLVAALALRRAGMQATVFEAAPDGSTVARPCNRRSPDEERAPRPQPVPDR